MSYICEAFCNCRRTRCVAVQILVVLLTFVRAPSSHGAEVQNDGQLVPQEARKVLEVIRDQERRLRNLHVVGHLVRERMKGGQLAPTPESLDVQFWSDGFPGGKARADVNREIIRWDGSHSGYSEQAYVAAFDGAVGKLVRRKTGGLGSSAAPGESVVTGQRPSELRSRSLDLATGAAFTIYLYRNAEGQSFSQYFEGKVLELAKLAAQHRNPAPSVGVANDVVDGAPCVRLSIGKDESYWFNPAKGYALVASKMVLRGSDGKEAVQWETRVDRLIDAGDGIWWPGQCWLYAGNEGPQRVIVKVDRATANAMEFDADIFKLKLPVGDYVLNEDTGRTFRVAPGPTTLQADLEQTVREAMRKRAATTRDASQTGPNSDQPGQHGPDRSG